MSLKDLKIGQEITLVSKGIHHSSFGANYDYIDSDMVGRISFLKITRKGIKYLYGEYIYFEEDGKKSYNWETKVNTDEYIIFPTVRRDLSEKNWQFRKAIDDYEKLQRKTEYDLDRKYDELKRKEFDQWREQNPRPTQKIEDYR